MPDPATAPPVVVPDDGWLERLGIPDDHILSETEFEEELAKHIGETIDG